MVTDTGNQNQVTDDQLDTEITELNQKADRTEDESNKLETLKSERTTRVQKRIDQLTWQKKDAEERYGKASKEAEELRVRVSELESEKKNSPVSVTKETVEIDGKQYYTDKALISMRDAGEISDLEAGELQRDRDKAEAADRAYQRLKKDQDEEKVNNLREEDRAKVLNEYPHFAKTLPDGSHNPSFNPEDPLYKLTNELWNEGYASHPQGLSKAITRAKQILRTDSGNIDISDDLRVSSPSAPRTPSKNEKIVSLSDEEKETAIRMFRDKVNPETGRVYTETEIITKATRAKNSRNSSRRVK